MMKYILSLCLLFILGACSDRHPDEVGSIDGNGNELTLSLSLPTDELRASFNQVEGSLDMQTRWSKYDEVHFFAEQGDKLFDLGKTGVFNLDDDSRQAKIKVATGAIVRDKPFTLYGVYYAEANIGEKSILVSARQRLGVPLRLFNPPLYCKVDIDNLTQHKGELDVRFRHYGIYEVTHLRNESDKAIAIRATYWQDGDNLPTPLSGAEIDIKESDIIDDEMTSNDAPSAGSRGNSWGGAVLSPDNTRRPWAINNEVFNLSTEKVLYDKPKLLDMGVAIQIPPGQTKSFVSWTVLSASKELPKALVLSTVIKPHNEIARQVYSQIYKKAAQRGLQIGRTYHLTAVWDGHKMMIGELDPLALEFSTVELNIGKVKEIDVTQGNALRLENDREDIIAVNLTEGGKKIRLEGKSEGTANIKVFNATHYVILQVTVNKQEDPEEPPTDPNIPWEEIISEDYELSSDGLTLVKWKNQNTKHLDMNREPRLKKVTNIGEKAFLECHQITSINIPSSVTKIEWLAFSRCISLTSINIPRSVTKIERRTFWGCSSLTSVKIPDSVTSIEESTFRDCHSLTSINIPNSVTSIGKDAFWDCHNLTSINIPNSVTKIGESAFYNCVSIKSINIPNSVTNIGKFAFRDCLSLTNINIPSSVTKIEKSAFFNCSSLTSINIPSSVTSIEESTFYYCRNLTSINIPSSVTKIEKSAFFNCNSLTSINIPSSVTSIGESAFSSCDNLTSIDIPNSVTSIGEYAFSGCINLTSISIPSSVTSIGIYAFWSCRSLKNINIPSSITRIEANAFRNCANLTNINIPNSVTSIGWQTFMNCPSLTSINIPNSVTSIGWRTFMGCTSLTSITVRSTELVMYDYEMLNNTPKLKHIYVPANLVEKYRTANGWKAFADKIEAIP